MRNPAADFKPRDVLKRAEEENFARVDAKDLPALLLKMWEYDGDILTIYALQLMAYLWVRTSELIEAEWPEFDLDCARWEIPPEANEEKASAYRTAAKASCSNTASFVLAHR